MRSPRGHVRSSPRQSSAASLCWAYALCKEIGADPAVVAHRCALSMPGVATVILGVKNRDELKQCIDAEAVGQLEPSVIARIDALGLRV